MRMFCSVTNYCRDRLVKLIEIDRLNQMSGKADLEALLNVLFLAIAT
jgi:hypothetical protein